MSLGREDFIEDICILYCGMDTCTRILEWFKENDVLTEEVFRTFLLESSNCTVGQMVKFIMKKRKEGKETGE